MNSLNILSSRVIGQSIPGSTRPRSRSQDEILSPNHANDHPRGRFLSAQGTGATKSFLDSTDEKHVKAEEPDQDGKEDLESFTEKSALLGNTTKDDVSRYKTKLQNLVRRIAAALTALLTTVGAPVVYVVNCFKDEDGHYAPLLPLKRVRPLFGGRKSTTSTATAVGLSKFAKDKGRGAEKAQTKRRAYVAKLRSSASNDSLTSNTSESEAEKRKTRPRSSEVRQPKSRPDENVTARRSIRIQEYRTESFSQRKQNRKSVIGEEPLTLDTIKSPMSASQSLKIHKYPHAPAPPRPLIPRRQPSYSNLIPRAPSIRAPQYQKTLVLDLDETLIHSLAKGGRMSSGHMVEVKLNAPVGLSASANAPVIGPQHPILYYVHKRPHCDEFLRKVCQWYKLVVFTASVQEYADPVVDWLEQERKFFQGRYYRQHCTFRNGAYIKDLSSIEPDLSRVAILDNSPMSYIFHEGMIYGISGWSNCGLTRDADNAIPIEGWINDPTDNDLMHLIPVLEALQYVTDVRALLALRRGEAEV
jgi:CTD nuclear envelope phosphatase 1